MNNSSLSQRLIARLGGGIAAACGIAVLVGIPQLSNPGPRRWVLIGVGAAAVICSVITWQLPWERWGPKASLWLVPLALCAVAISNMASLPKMPFMYSIFYLAIFGWIGLGHPQLTSLKMAPLGTVSYLSPLALTPGDVEQPIILLASWSFLLPICLLIGESLSWISGRLRQAEKLDIDRMDRMAELLEASSTLALAADPHSLADTVASMAGRMLDGKAAVTMLLESDGTLLTTASWQWHAPLVTINANGNQPPGIVDAVRADEVRMLDEPGAVNGRLLVLPLRGAGEPIGAVGIVLDKSIVVPDPFIKDLGRTLATQSALAFERIWAMQSLVDESLRDELTGLGNRRHGAVLLSHLAPGDMVVMLDLDHFKDVNDIFGHAAGDDLLRTIGTYLSDALRDSDQVARWGGDEFLIVLHGANEAAGAAMERIRAGWLATGPAATFSAGIAAHASGSTPSETLSRADTAMYHAKRAGRDRICTEAASAEARA